MRNLTVKVVRVKGFCPIYREGDTFTILEGYKLKTKKIICMHSLASLLPYYVALSHGASPKGLGLSQQDENTAYVQCLDPCDYTNGGTVVFSIKIGGCS